MSWLERLRTMLGFEGPLSVRDMLEVTLKSDSTAATSFTMQERSMLLNILRFGALRVEDVMVPRADIIALEAQMTLEELLVLFEKAGHSRLPIYRESLDDPLGMIHIKDVIGWIARGYDLDVTSDEKARQKISVDLLAEDEKPAKIHIQDDLAGGTDFQAINLKSVDLSAPISSVPIRRDVLFVPPSMSVVDLLLRMQSTHVHMALVIDEYGGTDGLVSIEDLVEEIVGEIEDEHDSNGQPMIEGEKGKDLIADARAPIEELEEHLSLSLSLPDRDEDDVDTLGGLIFSIVGRIPVRGELVRHPAGIEFEVLDADPRRINKLKIHLVSSRPQK